MTFRRLIVEILLTWLGATIGAILIFGSLSLPGLKKPVFEWLFGIGIILVAVSIGYAFFMVMRDLIERGVYGDDF